MKKIKVAKLGTVCSDKATELEGTLTHWTIGMSGQIDYLFQPKGLNEDGQPVDRIYFEPERLNLKEDDYEEVEVPLEILGTIVTDNASGFTGMAVSFIRHINGCFHVYIQPKGLNKKTNQPIRRNDFDLRSCSGEMLTKMSEEELERSKKDKPSPTGDTLDFTPSIRPVDVEK